MKDNIVYNHPDNQLYIKSEGDKEALWIALNNDRIDVIATDHAPHTIEEKSKTYLDCPSGGPLVQHGLISMIH